MLVVNVHRANIIHTTTCLHLPYRKGKGEDKKPFIHRALRTMLGWGRGAVILENFYV